MKSNIRVTYVDLRNIFNDMSKFKEKYEGVKVVMDMATITRDIITLSKCVCDCQQNNHLEDNLYKLKHLLELRSQFSC